MQRDAKEKPTGTGRDAAARLGHHRTPRVAGAAAEKKAADEFDVDAAFAKLKQLGGKSE